jgi:YspA, cpYpsA-related SLOG family
MAVRVICCGSRSWNDRALIADTLGDLVLEHNWQFPNPIVVHGACPRGADRLVDEEAGKAGMITEPHPADWERYGKRPGFIRNEQMAAAGAILCVAFWDGKSNGTRDMLARAANHGIPTLPIER